MSLRRSLGRLDVVCIGTNAIVGSGIFALPDDLFREMGGRSPLAFAFCALALAPIALCYAEAASRTEQSGGPYVYVREAFGPWPGFAVGWMCYANSLFSFAAVAAVAGAAMERSLSLGLGARAIGALCIALFGGLNVLGAKPGARTIDFFTFAKIAVLLIAVGAWFPSVSAANWTAPSRGASHMGGALFLALFALQGFEVAPVPAGETASAKRAMPFAVLASLGGAALLYVVVQLVLVGAYRALARPSDTPLVDAAFALSPRLAPLVAAGAIFSTVGFVAGNALGTPRYAFAAASDGHLPSALATVHPRFATPHRAIVVTSIVAIALVLLFDYRHLIGISNVTVATQYLGTSLAAWRLRRKQGPAPFRAPGGAVLFALAALLSATVFWFASVSELAWSGAALALGMVIAWGTARRRASA